MLDLPERPEYSHWGDGVGLKKDHRVRINEYTGFEYNKVSIY